MAQHISGNDGSHQGMYSNLERHVLIFQTGALLEVSFIEQKKILLSIKILVVQSLNTILVVSARLRFGQFPFFHKTLL